ncbi:Hpt domain-containing protein [Thermodesulfatator atlanticus]
MEKKLVWDKESFFEELEHDRGEIKDLLEVYLSSSKKLLADIERALASGDLDLARRSAHALKGASATIFLESVRVLALNLEKASDLEEANDLLFELKEQLNEFWQKITSGDYGD